MHEYSSVSVCLCKFAKRFNFFKLNWNKFFERNKQLTLLRLQKSNSQQYDRFEVDVQCSPKTGSKCQGKNHFTAFFKAVESNIFKSRSKTINKVKHVLIEDNSGNYKYKISIVC